MTSKELFEEAARHRAAAKAAERRGREADAAREMHLFHVNTELALAAEAVERRGEVFGAGQ